MAVHRVQIKRGNEAWAQCAEQLDALSDLAERLEQCYQSTESARGRVQNYKDEAFLSAIAEGKLDGKNAEQRDAQMRVVLNRDVTYLSLASEQQDGEDNERQTKTAWGITTLKLQAYRYLVQLRTAQLNALAGKD